MEWIVPEPGRHPNYDMYQRAAEIFRYEGASAARAASLLKPEGLRAVCDVYEVEGISVEDWPVFPSRRIRQLAAHRLTQVHRLPAAFEPLRISEAVMVLQYYRPGGREPAFQAGPPRRPLKRGAPGPMKPKGQP